MFIELAHYTLLFAAAMIGLQMILLMPTLWSKGAALAIKLGFRGSLFGVGLLILSFIILMYSYAVYDFSVAVVFETFSSVDSGTLILPAFLSSREGYFFAWILAIGTSGVIGFSKQDLPTYQERGRYLFAFNAFVFLLLIFMLTTADPFSRIVDPPMEGLGVKPQTAHISFLLEQILLFAAYGILAVGFIKAVCMFSKNRSFIEPTVRTTQIALMLLIGAAAFEFISRLTCTENAGFFDWLPSASLELTVIILAIGQLFLLYFAKLANVFSNWIIFFGLCLLCFFSANFFATEYRLFSLTASDVYFPNPVIAASSLFGVMCFLLFFLSSLTNKTIKENGFTLFSRESFIGLAAATCLSAGLSIGIIALLPALFVFIPDMPLRLLPELLHKVIFWHMLAFSVFVGIAFMRQPIKSGWIKINTPVWGTFGTIIALISLFVSKQTLTVILFALPSLILLITVLSIYSFRIPRNAKAMMEALKAIPIFVRGITACAIGFFLFCAAFSTALTFSQQKTETFPVKNEIVLDALIFKTETLSVKTEESTGSYRLLPMKKDGNGEPYVLKGSDTYQGSEKQPDLTILNMSLPQFSLSVITHAISDSVTIQTTTFPALRLIWTGLFLIIIGLGAMTYCWKRGSVK